MGQYGTIFGNSISYWAISISIFHYLNVSLTLTLTLTTLSSSRTSFRSLKMIGYFMIYRFPILVHNMLHIFNKHCNICCLFPFKFQLSSFCPVFPQMKTNCLSSEIQPCNCNQQMAAQQQIYISCLYTSYSENKDISRQSYI